MKRATRTREAAFVVLAYVVGMLVWAVVAPPACARQCNDADEQGQCGLREYIHGEGAP